jgi:hypothetical protein
MLRRSLQVLSDLPEKLSSCVRQCATITPPFERNAQFWPKPKSCILSYIDKRMNHNRSHAVASGDRIGGLY